MAEMEYWEFLLQKEGDRSWLPLESPTVEILEGRYRVVARSSRKQTNVEVRIMHQATEEVPPKRRTQKRSNRTNADGLVVVIPYTSLKSGTWELTCSGDLMSELMGNGWQYSVQFEVSPIEPDEEWEPNWQTSPEPVESTIEIADSTPESAIVSSQPTAESWDSPELTPEETPAESVNAAESSVDRLLQITEQLAQESGQASQLPPLQIVLTQDTYIARRGQPLTLSGQIIPVDQSETPVLLTHAEIRICFRDPQSAKVLLETRKPILNQSIPTPITCNLTLPSDFKTQLILGEVTFYDLTLASEEPSVLASQSFTLTADADELLETIADHPIADEEELERSLESAANAAEKPSESPSLNLTFLNLVATPKEPPSFKYASDQPLPPQLHPSASTSEGSKKGLDLPSFAVPVSAASAEAAIVPETEEADSIESASIQPQLTLPPEPESQRLGAIAKVSPVQSAFQALNIQGRFLDRLNLLASDTELSEELRETIPEPESATLPESPIEGAIVPSTSFETTALPLSLEDKLLSQEVVVEDEPLIEAISTPQKQPQPSVNQVPNPLFLSLDQDVPTPILDLVGEELIAGRSIAIRARLPNLLPRFYVKFWINDRQTRALLDGPRWLVDFAPNGLGDLEASTQLIVPFGSLEIQLEAIAVEVATQRESHKVVLDRAVIPPDLPDLSLDEFDA
ncbi:hypothetical protein [Phormidesmis priestleyi]|uniref:hypothetical protein n=1 Tax=Phormidesmis priestleyi TaxID=268141 RepID=UPI00083B6884|nr:hypothetical protein [Phormidesmis priestleyi]